MPGLRETARLVGVDHGYLSRLAKSGRVPKNPDGTFDVEAVRKAIAAQTDPAMVREKRPKAEPSAPVTEGGDQPSPPPVTTSPVTTPVDAAAAAALIRQVLAEEGDTSFANARMAETILKARERHLKVLQRRGELVSIAAVRRHVDKGFIALRQVIQRLPSRHASAMAAELGCNAAALDALLTKAIANDLEELAAPVIRA